MAKNSRAAAEAAGEAADPGKPLPGEDLTTRDPEDAVHWASVYAELLAFKDLMLQTTRHQLEGMSADAAAEVKKVDQTLLLLERKRLEARHRLWKERIQALRPTAG